MPFHSSWVPHSFAVFEGVGPRGGISDLQRPIPDSRVLAVSGPRNRSTVSVNGWVFAPSVIHTLDPRRSARLKSCPDTNQKSPGDAPVKPVHHPASFLTPLPALPFPSDPRHARNVIPDAVGPLCRSNDTT